LSEEVEGDYSAAPLFRRNSPIEFGVPRGIFSKYIILSPMKYLGLTIRLEGVVAA
jgi:hypothetical protein